MAKQWNWKTSILSFIVGLLVGRMVRGLGEKRSLPMGQESAASADYYLSPSEIKHLTDEGIGAALALMGIGMELAKEMGREITPAEIGESIQEIDLDAAMDRSVENVVRKHGARPPSFLVSAFSIAFKKGFRSLASRIVLEGIPPVPSVLSHDGYFLAEKIVAKIIQKLKDRDEESYRTLLTKIPEIESVLGKWISESRPEPYTRLLLQFVNNVKADSSSPRSAARE